MNILEGKKVLITGGTGSLGKTLVKRMLSGKNGCPRQIVVFSRDEAKQHAMRCEYLNLKAATDEVIYSNFKQTVEFQIGDIRDYNSVKTAVQSKDIIIHASAMKQVPACEYFVEQAIKTNVVGTLNLVKAVKAVSEEKSSILVESVVGVSTDKACKPVNAYGMTKALMEKIIISANVKSSIPFSCVRYGNVLASTGSVIPLFYDQIRKGGPITITSKDMTRFLMPLERAVDTIILALERKCKGEIVIPVIPSAKIYDLATSMIGSKQIAIQDIGIRPGEKLYEILISEEECHRTKVVHTADGKDYYIVAPALPEIRVQADEGSPYPLLGEYSSVSLLMDQAGVLSLLNDNNLLDKNL